MPRFRRSPRSLRSIVAVALAGVIVFVCRWLPHVDVTTATLALVLVVVGVGLRWGRAEALLAALVASLGLDYYFLPPRGFGIDAPDHWIALVAFVMTALGIALARSRARQKETEAEIIRRSDVLKSAVFSALAHDARGPLGSIKVAASALFSDHAGDAEERRELASIILEEVDRMNRWIDETSELSQVDPTRFPLNRASCDVPRLVADAVAGFGPRLAGRPFATDLPDSLPRPSATRR